MGNLFLSLFNFFQKHKWLLVFSLLLVFAASAFLTSRLKFEEDISRIIPADEKTDKLNFIFQNSKFMERIIVRISLKDPKAEANPDVLKVACDHLQKGLEANSKKYYREITAQVPDEVIRNVYGILYNNLPLFLEEQDYKHIDSLLSEEQVRKTLKKDYQALMLPSGFIMKENILRDPMNLTPLVLKKLQSLQFDENFQVNDGYIMTRDGKNLLMFVIPLTKSSETGNNDKLITQLDKALEATKKDLGDKVSIEYFGGTAVSVANARQIKKDISLTTSIALIFLMLFISFYFRSKSIFFLIFIPIVFGAVVSLAILYLIQGSVSAVALGVGSILLGIAINISLHIFTHFRTHGTAKDVLKDISSAAILTALTTSSAFFCLLLLESDAMKDLGLFAGISIMVASVSSLVIMPHLLKWRESRQILITNSWLDRIAAFDYHKSKLVILLIAGLTILCSFFFTRVSFESDMNRMSYVPKSLQDAENHLDEIASYKLRNMFVVSSGTTLDEALRKNEKVQARVEGLSKKGLVRKFTNVGLLLISDSLQKVRMDHWKSFWTEEKKHSLQANIQLAAGELKFREGSFDPFFHWLGKDFTMLPKADADTLRKLLLDDYITSRDGMTTVVTLLKVKAEDKDKVYKSFDEEKESLLVDKQYLTNRFVSVLNNDFNLLLYLSFFIVFFLILISFGRIELTLLCVIPMMMSWILTLGIMGILGIRFNIFNIIISTFIFGMGDDFSVFVVTGLQQKYATGKSNLASYKTSILLSAITTLTGIGVLIFAKHPAIQSIALISIIGIFSVIVISYTIQPIIFNFFAQKRKEQGRIPMTFYNFIISVIAFTYFFVGCIVLTISGVILVKLIPTRPTRNLFYVFMSKYCKSLTDIMYIVKKDIPKNVREQLGKPGVIIANHASFVDILMISRLSPKIIMLTNDWVYNRSVYSWVVRMAGFYHVKEGYEGSVDYLKGKVEEGFHIMAFPEGTRSPDGKIGRFHKGAFYIAEQLNLDIIPVVIHGLQHGMPKGDYLLKHSKCTIRVLDRIRPDDKTFGNGYSERARSITRCFKAEYEKIRMATETPEYFNFIVRQNYVLKGPVLEWYVYVKLMLEKNYQEFNKLLPREGRIYDVGCGYGYISLILNLVSEKREMIGLDYDEEKILIAQNVPSRASNVHFHQADIREFHYENADAFLVSDVLHYLPKQDQKDLLKCYAESLNEGGLILIREADSDAEGKHTRSRWTEIISTTVGFNKARFEDMEFLSGKELKTYLESLGLSVHKTDESDTTSNALFVARKPRLTP